MSSPPTKPLEYRILQSLGTLIDYASGNWEPEPEDLADAVALANLRMCEALDRDFAEGGSDG